MQFKAPEFAGLDEKVRSALLRVSIRRSFNEGEFVYLQDDDAEALYLIASGHIRLSYLMEDGSAILYSILPAGESFGELGVLDGNCYCDMATAIGKTIVASISVNLFRSLCREYPVLHDALARLVARRHRSYIDLTRNLSLKTLPARLARALLRLADGLGTKWPHARGEVACLGAIVTQADLGLMARGARGNVNRALKTWERSGWIAMHERNILILERRKLELLAIEEGIECLETDLPKQMRT